MKNEIILIKGLFRGVVHWGDFPSYLQSHFPNYEIRCFDILGNGEFSSQTSSTSIETMVESIRMQRETNQIADIIAISMGGMIGIKWAELYPKEVNNLICINSSANTFSPFYQRLLPSNYLMIIKALCVNSFEREKIIYRMNSNKVLDINKIMQWAKYADEHPVNKMNFFRQLYAAIKFDIKNKPSCKLHFIASKQDKLVSFKATSAIAKAWNLPLIVNENDGHDIPCDNPEWLVTKLKEILG